MNRVNIFPGHIPLRQSPPLVNKRYRYFKIQLKGVLLITTRRGCCISFRLVWCMCHCALNLAEGRNITSGKASMGQHRKH